MQTVGVGGNLVDKRAIQEKDFAKIRQNAVELVGVVQAALTHMTDTPLLRKQGVLGSTMRLAL